MRTTTLQKLSELQKNTRNIRNICILAHVDHGKTTLADTLVASNGIISQRMAGKLRYLDSREDEQLRGITMKSSAISLQYSTAGEDYLINLIDSPGHIDFSSEVSTAVRLCDGALVLVDVVEGVCPQTHAVLRQAWLENIKPVLVLNKIDRLISELRMTPLEAYVHLQQLLEQVNAITGELFASQVLEQTSTKTTKDDQKQLSGDHVFDWSSGLEDTDDSTLYFSPDQDNVVFASAVDGWGFGIKHFAELYSAKLGFKSEVLLKTLWGDFFLENKTKRIKKGAQAKGKKPLFVQFILENLWAVYDAVVFMRDEEKIEKIVKSMNLKIQARDLRHSDPKVLLNAITSQWLSVSAAVLSMVVKCLPSPLDVSTERSEKLLCASTQRFDSLPWETRSLKDDFMACSAAEDAPIIIYVSKMFSVDEKMLPRNKPKLRPLTAEEISRRREAAKQRLADKAAEHAGGESKLQGLAGGESKLQGLSDVGTVTSESGSAVTDQKKMGEDQVFIAFARIFSGTVKAGQKLYVLGPKHNPAALVDQLDECGGDMSTLLPSLSHVDELTVTDLYMFMGKELEAVDQVPVGNILGLGGLEDVVIKTATLSSIVMCPAFTDMYFEAAPIVKASLEPSHPGDMRKLVHGLKLLNQADPCVRVSVQGTGEHVITVAGEVHLNKCLDDLRERYAKIEINVSRCLVPFRETIVLPPMFDNVNEAIEGQTVEKPTASSEEHIDAVEMQTANKLCSIRVKACSLPSTVTALLGDNPSLIKTLDFYTSAKISGNVDDQMRDLVKPETITALREFKRKLELAFSDSELHWQGASDQIWSFGPRRSGPNLLLNRVEGYQRHSIWACLDGAMQHENKQPSQIWEFDNSIVSGFQMATLSGPLCEEPMRGVCFIMEKWETDEQLRQAERERTTSDKVHGDKREHHVPGRIRTQSGMFSEGSDDDSDDDLQTLPKLQSLTIKEADISQWADSSDLSDTSTGIKSPQEPYSSQTTTKNTAPDSASSQCSLDVAGAKKKLIAYGPFSGQLMSCMKEVCRKSFQSKPQRLMAAMYSCTVKATAEVLGKLYGVLGKRHGRVLHEDMKEGTSLFSVQALLPVVESFGFAEEIRKKTSGLASPQLVFSHWEVIDLDPFWVPTTEEEYLHFGEKADSENQARRYMDQVRKRKGLKVEEKLVESAEKQRTRSRNK